MKLMIGFMYRARGLFGLFVADWATIMQTEMNVAE
jgi:hypothetical protein